MDKQEQLQEQYEDALFALAMNKIATAEGQWAIEENERLKNDPAAAVPEELDRRCMQTIQRQFAKQKVYTVGRFTVKAVKRVVMAAGIAALLFTGAFATSETIRINTLNLVVQVFEDNTDFRFVSHPAENTPQMNVGWVPDGFVLVDQGINSKSIWYQYQKTENESLYINYNTTTGTGIGVDTEGAEVGYVDINDGKAMLINKGNELQIVWATKNNAAFIGIIGEGIDQEDLIRVANELKY
ncbi:MAG: DUF4367 domain-containing protein [Oscillospiraceae bacterium]|jgi:hypothetical protein|nr:DUF4367 domain-containing protein [Oscillospiraceae bacterium]